MREKWACAVLGSLRKRSAIQPAVNSLLDAEVFLARRRGVARHPIGGFGARRCRGACARSAAARSTTVGVESLRRLARRRKHQLRRPRRSCRRAAALNAAEHVRRGRCCALEPAGARSRPWRWAPFSIDRGPRLDDRRRVAAEADALRVARLRRRSRRAACSMRALSSARRDEVAEGLRISSFERRADMDSFRQASRTGACAPARSPCASKARASAKRPFGQSAACRRQRSRGRSRDQRAPATASPRRGGGTSRCSASSDWQR